MRQHRTGRVSLPIAKLALTAILGLALALTFSCSAVEDLLNNDNCSNNLLDSGYDPADIPEPDSSSGSGDEEGNVEPPDDNDNISVPNSQGAVVVGPLLKANWGRGNPYDPFHTLPDGSKGWIGCVNVAIAQILYHHKYPTQGTGHDSYKGVIFDWDNMLDSYRNVNLTEKQRKAITSLMHSLSLGYGSRKFEGNFGYDKSIQTLYRKYYDDSEWATIWTAKIKKQMDLGLPVYCHGENLAGTSGHGFVLDGYDNRGKIHVNWGWGGTADGYYPIDSLTPNGRTLENGFHNRNFKCTINLKPDEGGVGTYELALDTFAIEKKSILSNEQVTVVAKINPQGTFPAGQVAVALVDNRGNIVKVVGATNFRKSFSTSFTPSEMVEPGQYSLRVVAKPDGKDWEIITLSDITKSVPKAINIAVSQFRGAKGGGWGLSLRRFNVIDDKTVVAHNEEFTVDLSLSDVNSTSFPKVTSGVALIDENNEIVAILGELNIPSNANLNRASGKKIKCKVPSSVAFGQYKLRIVVKTEGQNEWRVVTQTDGNIQTTMDFTVQEFSVAGGGIGNSFAGNGVCPY
ncbi:MAG: C10 family peptidase [Fibromonadaceae bacterium]|jgi:hypothetical protein|nr:C10 family peptidase [Fibromonadaceae bacterium]